MDPCIKDRLRSHPDTHHMRSSGGAYFLAAAIALTMSANSAGTGREARQNSIERIAACDTDKARIWPWLVVVLCTNVFKTSQGVPSSCGSSGVQKRVGPGEENRAPLHVRAYISL
jgi:hypothetical protein